MTITEIYDKYKINKGLREHMIRVAAVAKMICNSSCDDLDTENIITACLLHDMGNIVKTKFNLVSELFEPEGVEYYKKVQQEVFNKYGTKEHEVTLAILSEIGVADEIVKIINTTGLSSVPDIAKTGTIVEKIMMYSDLRVGIFGIVSLDVRLDDIKERYTLEQYSSDFLEVVRSLMKEFEKEIFENSKIKPEDITDKSTKEIQKKLWNWEIL